MTRSRIETWAWMTQSSPIRAPGPMTAWGYTIVRAPMTAPAPTVTYGPIETSAPIAASLAIAARRSTPVAGGAVGTNSDTARANAEYGSSARRTAHGGADASRVAVPRMTAEAFVAAICPR